MRKQNLYRYDKEEAAEKARQALGSEQEEREKVDLPKVTPVEQLEKSRWKPVTKPNKKR